MLPTSLRGRSASSYRNNSLMPQYLRRIIKVSKWKVWWCISSFSSLLLASHTLDPVLCYQQIAILVEFIFTRGNIRGWVDQIGQERRDTRGRFLWLTSPDGFGETKNQWARDDPAFVVISCLLLAVSAAAFCAAYGGSVAHAGFTILSVVCLHFFLIGSSLATLFWFFSNDYLREEAAVHTHVVEQRVEWLYAFDVHCNAYFPLFVLLYVLQYFLSPLLLAHGFVPTLLSNLLYVVASCYYHYLNFLGYDVLPFLERTTVFLYPVALLIILFPFSVLAGFNPTRFTLSFYFG